MEWLDPLVRFVLFGLLLIGAFFLGVQSLSRSLHGRLACVLIVCIACQVLSGHAGIRAFMGPSSWVITGLASLSAFVFWLTAHAFFVDGFRFRWVHAMMGLAILVFSVFHQFVAPPRELVGAVLLLINFGLVTHGIVRVWLGHSIDLDLRRYRFRARFAVLPSAYVCVVAIEEFAALKGQEAILDALNFANTVLLATITSYLGILLHHYVISRSITAPEPSLTRNEAFRSRLSLSDQDIFDLICEHFEKRRVFTDDQLSLAALAHLVAQPLSKVRKSVCGAYGYRNFNKLLDGFRVEAAKSYLGDVDEAHMPLVDIAAMVGYTSTGALTRAFNLETGESPAQYRQRAVEANSASPKLQLTNTDR